MQRVRTLDLTKIGMFTLKSNQRNILHILNKNSSKLSENTKILSENTALLVSIKDSIDNLVVVITNFISKIEKRDKDMLEKKYHEKFQVLAAIRGVLIVLLNIKEEMKIKKDKKNNPKKENENSDKNIVKPARTKIYYRIRKNK